VPEDYHHKYTTSFRFILLRLKRAAKKLLKTHRRDRGVSFWWLMMSNGLGGDSSELRDN
jgi:hypothetical protein